MTDLPRPAAPDANPAAASASPAPDPARLAARIYAQIADELGVKPWQVKAAVELLDGGSTVPFISRYRKEVTGTLDDAQLRDLEERLRYLRELEDRRQSVLESIAQQGKLTAELEASINAADTKARLEDIYLPFKSKRRTKAQIAREAGLEPLADALLADPGLEPEAAAGGYLNPEHAVNEPAEALAGARAILVERVSQDADLVSELRERVWTQGRVRAQVREGMEAEGQKFADYFDFAQLPSQLPSHRVLALLRGEKEGVLELNIAEADASDQEEYAAARARFEGSVARALGVADRGRPADKWLMQTAQLGWRRILVKLAIDLRVRLFTDAEDEAVRIFAANLRDVLLAAPAGNRATLGLDPGLRTGVKVAVVNGTGKVVATSTIYPHAPAKKWNDALATLARLCEQHQVDLVAIGNGTASRETDKLANELIKLMAPKQKLQKLVVSEAGASVYSASALASAELPELDVSLRGAVSIARRLQDPLAELVKIDPKSIGVGQYQHDVTANKLERSLDAVVEDCVNAVGVDVNTASPALLARVAGVGPLLSGNIVAYRDENGPFAKRSDLKKVPRLGAKAFEQCAGFLRITGGAEPLDSSSVHPEAYGVARKVLAAAGAAAADVPRGLGSLATLDPQAFVDEKFGLPTVRDIMAELEKPGRDPRPVFTTASFSEGVEKISDLKPGMILEGTVTNVAAFGAFVDVGVHQDGLVHISAMSNKFVSDPHEVVKSGQVVKVKVLEADPDRKRISLSLRLDDEAPTEGGARQGQRNGARPGAESARNREDDAGRNRGGDRGRNRGGETQQGRRGNGGRQQRPQAGGSNSNSNNSNTAMAEALRRAGLGK
ncbi:Tex family protein [Arthrobacter sp. Marseille-P9274]|uniref:Tex family protein n=1 Tax=Arthrobacter sp. Marseille-P9274 TaxID=2866572 RepID=UPI0027B9403E|nr:Tex family protein [Arthrobacter sp. Marseille-P9274]